MPEGFDNPDWWRQAWQLIREQAEELSDDFQGNISTSWNAIRRVRQYDCEGEWVIYVETAMTGLAAALYLLLVPQIDEILENYLQPKNGRGGSRRGRRGRRRWRSGNRGQRRLFFSNILPDMDEEIAKRLPGHRRLAMRRIGPGEWLAFTGIQAMDRVFWYWLLTEATEVFATTWQSEIQKSERCREAGDALLQCVFARPPENGSGPLWHHISDDQKTTEKNVLAGSSGTIQAKTGYYLDGWSVMEWNIRGVEEYGEDSFTYEYTVHLTALLTNGTWVTLKRGTAQLHVPPGGWGSTTITVQSDLNHVVEIQYQFTRELIAGTGWPFGYGYDGRVSFTGWSRVTDE